MPAQSGLGFSGIVAIQIPDDGAAGTVLTKLTPDNYDYDWLPGGGGGGAPANAQYVVLALDATLTDERVLTAGTGIAIVDGGAGGPVTLSIAAGIVTLQFAYDASGVTQPKILVTAANGPITIRDAAVPIGDLFILESNAGVDFFNIDPASLDYGAAGNREFDILTDPTGRGSIRFLPNGRTTTTVALGGSGLSWSSLSIQAIPGGGGLGNDTMPSAIAWTGEARFDDPGFVFSSGLLFNMQATVTANGVNVGPIYTLINQPRLRTGTLGGARTFSQQNAVRSQLAVGPNLAGSVTLTSHETFLATLVVDASGGAATIGTVNYVALFAPTLVAGGTIGTLRCINIPNIPAAGITTIRGIDSEMGSGIFINHTGVAPSLHTGNFQLANATLLQFGTVSLVSMDRVAANVLRFLGNTEDIRFSFATADVVDLSSTTGAGLRLNYTEMAFGNGSGNPNGTNGWNILEAPGARTVTLAGEFNRHLFSASANLTIDAALNDLSTFKINEPGAVIGTGSVVNAANVIVQTAPSVGTNRYGLLITSNPSGGTLNYAFRQSNVAALSRFDGLVDLNRPIALGGGAAATLGTIGGAGPAAAAQAQWIQVQVNGVNHWIPAWT